MNITKYYGAPGTGKTYTLIERVKDELENGISIDDIGYLGFTRASATEALSRATEKFGIKGGKRLWFRTVHSACLYLLRKRGINKKVVTYYNKKMFCGNHGLKYTWEGEEGILGDHTPDGNLFFDIYSYIENTMISPEEWKDTQYSADFKKDFPFFYDKWTEYKEQKNLIDFSDMIYFTLEEMANIPTKVLLVDEFQDLSPLQYQVIRQFMTGKERIYCGGDDDQAIYRFQGAVPEIFLNMKCNENHILPKSYRLPSKIWEVSKSLIEQNTRRQHKEIEPRVEGGIVQTLIRPPLWRIIKEIGNDTYVLFRTNYLVNQFGWEMARQGRLYKFLDGKKEEKLGWSNKGKRELYHNLYSRSDYERELSQMKARKMISKGYAYFVQSYIENYGKAIRLNEITTYIGTIHSAKGREANTVILFDDITGKVAGGMKTEQGLEDERRVFYVGMTRAKRKLVIVNNGFGHKALSFDLPNRINGAVNLI